MYLCILNDGSATYFHPATGSTSALDFSICGPWLWLISFRYHLYNLFLTWRVTTLSSHYHLYRLFLTWRMTTLSSRYHLYKLFLTWRMTTLFWCRFWNVTWTWPEMGRRRCLSGFPAEYKLYQLFPTLKECTVCPRTNGKEETVIARLRIGHSFITHSFLLKGEEPPVCIGCDQRLTIEQFYLIVQILLKQERAISQLSLCVLF